MPVARLPPALSCALALGALLHAAPPADAALQRPALEHECDRLAQPLRQAMGPLPAYVDGVAYADLRWPVARKACERARAEHPNEVRFVAYAARAANKAGDTREAARLYRAAADEGSVLAQTNLGVMYEKGEGGLRRDEHEAERLYRLAAEQGHPHAQSSLAFLHAYGRGGLQRNEQEAVRLWQLAAAQGDPGAQSNLGKMHADGRGGLSRDLNEAVRLWRLAAAQGAVEARSNLRKAGRS